MVKMYRRFYDMDDREVWASYDGENIEVLLQHTVEGFDVPTYRLEIRLLLESILKEEYGIVVSYQNWVFPVYNDKPEEELAFSDEDAPSSDGCQYKFFTDRGGNWLEFVVKGTDGGLDSLGEGHLDSLTSVLRQLLLRKGIDFKSFARYSEDLNNTEYHEPIVDDFLTDFDVTR